MCASRPSERHALQPPKGGKGESIPAKDRRRLSRLSSLEYAGEQPWNKFGMDNGEWTLAKLF